MASSVKLQNSNVTMTLGVSVLSQNIAKNQTTVRIVVNLKNPYGTYTYMGTGSSTYRIRWVVKNGSTTLYDSGSINFSYKIGNLNVLTLDRTITHNANGTVPSNAFSVTLSGGSGNTLTKGGSKTADVTASISTIPRRGEITALNTTNLGSNMVVTYTRPSNSFTYKAYYRINSGAWVGTNFSGLTIAQSVIPNTSSCNVTFKLETWNGSTKIGEHSKAWTCTVPSSVIPTFTGISHSEQNAFTKNNIGVYVQSKSSIKITLSGAKGAGGSTIKNYYINFNGVSTNTSTNALTRTPNTSGTLTATAYVTDSRGRKSASRTLGIKVLPYSAPKINSYSVQRTTSNGTTSDDGTYAKVTLSAQACSLKNGTTEKNLVRYRISSKLNNDTSYVAKSNNTTNTTLSISASPIVSSYAVDNSYDFKIEAYDIYGTTVTVYGVVPTGSVTMMWGRNQVSVGKRIDNTSANLLVGTAGILSDGGYRISDGTKVGRYIDRSNLLAVNTDLNEIKTEGTYYQGSSAHVATFKNCPTGYALQLEVLRHAGYMQRITTYNPNNLQIFIRNYYDGSWGAWTQIPTYANTHYIAYTGNGGATNPGYYIKFSDGTMIAYYSGSATVNCNTAYGSLFQGTLDIKFPTSFKTVHEVSVSRCRIDTGCSWGTTIAYSADGFTLRMMDAYSRTNRTCWYGYIAIGRWK